MKTLKMVAVLCLLQALPLQAYSAGVVLAKVVGVRTDSDGRGMVMFDANIGGTPASCRASGYLNALAFDTNTPAGRAILASALTAKATGVTVEAHGTGSCTLYGGSWVEDMHYSVALQ